MKTMPDHALPDKPLLLVVDDDPLLAETLGLALASDFDVVLSHSRPHSTQLLRQLRRPPDLALVDLGLPLPAYEQVCKASHSFNLLDARRAISVTERQRYILRVRKLAQAVAEAYYAQREKLGFPGLKKEPA